MVLTFWKVWCLKFKPSDDSQDSSEGIIGSVTALDQAYIHFGSGHFPARPAWKCYGFIFPQHDLWFLFKTTHPHKTNIYNSWDISYNMFAFTEKTLHLLKTWKEFIHSEFILKLRAYSTAFLE